MASWADGEADAAHLAMLVDELSLENSALREQFAALKALFDAELARRREASRPHDAAEQPSPGQGSSAATEVLTPSRTYVYTDVKAGNPALESERRVTEAVSRSVEDTAGLRDEVAVLRGERDGLQRNAGKAQTQLQALSTELAEWKHYSGQLQVEAAQCVDAARTARAEAAALRTLLIARNSGGYSLMGDAFQLLPGARGSPAKPGRPPEAEELSRFTAMAVGRKAVGRGADLGECSERTTRRGIGAMSY